MLSTKEAAARLGVSTGRIRQLIAEGRLTAQKTRDGWLVSESSVERRRGKAKPGRPAIGSDAERSLPFTLMQADVPVAHVVYSEPLGAFTQVALEDVEHAPLVLRGAQEENGGLLELFNEWWARRSIPVSRPGLDKLLKESGCASAMSLAVRGGGASYLDEYWLKPKGSKAKWAERNFRACGLPARKPDEPAWLGEWTGKSPDMTTNGVLPKRWLVDNEGKVVLVKSGGLDGREAVSELIATHLYRRLLRAGEYVEYRLAYWGGALASACQSFVGPQEEFIDAWSLCNSRHRHAKNSTYVHYFEICEQLAVPDASDLVDKMLVTDYILANPARTWHDFGVVRNTQTGHVRPAPLFDAGASLCARVPEIQLGREGSTYKSAPFDTNPDRQLGMVVDARWFHPDALEDFVGEAHVLMMRVLGGSGSVADKVCSDMEERITRVKAWYAKLPHPVIVGWDAPNSAETIEYITL